MTEEYILFPNYFQINNSDKYILLLMRTYKIKYILGTE